jgi:hypothetical protein
MLRPTILIVFAHNASNSVLPELELTKKQWSAEVRREQVLSSLAS